jgi:hypothetical protein
MSWLRNYNSGGDSLPNVVNIGPPGSVETTYSFDYGSVHFVVINEYYDGSSDVGSDGDVVDALHDWLVNDLTANQKPITFVVGHEPAYPQPDEENGRLRHENDSLYKYPVNRDRFWNTLIDYGVLAYLCGHTHNYSVVNINDVWQIDVGHARGTGDPGARSTYVLFNVTGSGMVFYNTYRLDPASGEYVVTNSDTLL